ncbi:MAG: sulfoxide reductase heme-binding subunit YedZ [Acidiferrobacterales bacterium]|nr:sulfoxide reductase heme-binding subunit YedZ [Acidiferrobacterales bacterium]
MAKASSKIWAVRIRRIKPVIFLLCLIPFGLLAYDFYTGNISADPVEDITKVTGDWGLRLLLITLAITPLRHLTSINQLILVRRMLGVFSFFYILLHFLTWLVIVNFFDIRQIIEDIIQRYYILFGSAAFLMMTLLAATSTNRMVRWMGGRRWAKLHKLVYLIGILGALHFFLAVKADITEPVIYGVILAVLLGFRVWKHYLPRTAKR